MRSAWSAPVASVAIAIGSSSACLEPLPDPTTCEPPSRVIDDACVPCDPPKQFVEDTCMICPPDALVPYSQCLPSAFVDEGVPANGCLAADGRYERFSCLTGDRSCACDADAEDALPACFSDGSECPEAIRKVMPDAICYPLEPGDVEPTAFGALGEGCGCGCYGAMAKCDGVGMTFGMFSDGTNAEELAFEGARIDLRDRLPASGSLGVYVRARGFAAPLAVAPAPTTTNRAWLFYFTSDFDEQVAYGPDQDGIDSTFQASPPYHFDDDLGRPTEIYLATGALTKETSLLTIYEVDCVIPFVVPD